MPFGRSVTSGEFGWPRGVHSASFISSGNKIFIFLPKLINCDNRRLASASPEASEAMASNQKHSLRFDTKTLAFQIDASQIVLCASELIATEACGTDLSAAHISHGKPSAPSTCRPAGLLNCLHLCKSRKPVITRDAFDATAMLLMPVPVHPDPRGTYRSFEIEPSLTSHTTCMLQSCT